MFEVHARAIPGMYRRRVSNILQNNTLMRGVGK
jgi:hypothetical protein